MQIWQYYGIQMSRQTLKNNRCKNPDCDKLLGAGWHPGFCSPPCRAVTSIKKGPPTECWPWIGPVDKDGYGRASTHGIRMHAHRAAWMAATGRKIPKGMIICHTCDNPPCCNPYHLFLGTIKDNARDMIRKGRASVLRGEDRYNAKLTEAAVRYIRKHQTRGGAGRLAEKFGVRPQCIFKVWRYALWSHVK